MGISCLSWAAGRGYYEVVCELLNIPNIKVNSQDQVNNKQQIKPIYC